MALSSPVHKGAAGDTWGYHRQFAAQLNSYCQTEAIQLSIARKGRCFMHIKRQWVALEIKWRRAGLRITSSPLETSSRWIRLDSYQIQRLSGAAWSPYADRVGDIFKN